MMKIVIAICCLTLYPFTYCYSAEVLIIDKNDVGCVLQYRGPVTEGDTDKIKAILIKVASNSKMDENGERISYNDDHFYIPGGNRICLDSPGGSYFEGIKMADLFSEVGLGTVVNENASCASACAVAFMGGTESTESDIGKIPDRILHTKGSLGFHAPYIRVPDQVYNKQTVEVAYGASTEAIGELMMRAKKLRFRNSLIAEFLFVGAADLLYIDTVGKAARWNINLAESRTPQNINNPQIMHACNNVWKWEADIVTYNTLGDKDHFVDWDVTMKKQDEYGMELQQEGYGQEGATTCSVYFATNEKKEIDDMMITFGGETGLWLDLPGWKMFPADTKINELGR